MPQGTPPCHGAPRPCSGPQSMPQGTPSMSRGTGPPCLPIVYIKCYILHRWRCQESLSCYLHVAEDPGESFAEIFHRVFLISALKVTSDCFHGPGRRRALSDWLLVRERHLGKAAGKQKTVTVKSKKKHNFIRELDLANSWYFILLILLFRNKCYVLGWEGGLINAVKLFILILEKLVSFVWYVQKELTIHGCC